MPRVPCGKGGCASRVRSLLADTWRCKACAKPFCGTHREPSSHACGRSIALMVAEREAQRAAATPLSSNRNFTRL